MCDCVFAGCNQTETDVYYYYYYYYFVLPLRFHVIMLECQTDGCPIEQETETHCKLNAFAECMRDNGAALSAKLAVQIMGLSDGRLHMNSSRRLVLVDMILMANLIACIEETASKLTIDNLYT